MAFGRLVVGPIRLALTRELKGYSLGAGGTAEIIKSGLDGYSAIVVVVKATFDAGATAGVRVRWLYSPDGASYDSPEEAERDGNYVDIGYDAAGNFAAAGATRQRTILVPVFAPHVKIQIVNLDPAVPVTLDVWTLLLR